MSGVHPGVARHALAAVVATVAALALASSALAAAWQPVVTVSPSGLASSSEALALSGSTAHVIYSRGVGNGVRYRRSTDGGARWSNEVSLALRDGTQHYYDVAIAARGSLVTVLYRGYNAATSQHTLLLRRSTNSGATWGTRVIIASYVAPERIGRASVALGGSTTTPSVHVAWTDGRTGTIRYRRSTDAGATFSTVVNLGTTTARPYEQTPTPAPPDGLVRLAATGVRVYVMWAPSGTAQFPDPPMFRRSFDSGASFSGVQPLPGGIAGIVAVSAYGSQLVVAQSEPNFGLVHLSHSGDSGSTFSHFATGQFGGDVVVGPGGQARYVSDGRAVRMRTSSNYGATWSPASHVAGSDTDYYKVHANVVLGASSTLVTWTRSYPEGSGIFSRRRS